MGFYTPEIECASSDYMHNLQSKRLLNTLSRVYENIPFYKNKFDEIGLSINDIHSIDDISKLPFTKKTDLRDNYPFGIFAVPKEKLLRIHASSGTTGKQTVVGYTKNDLDIWAECIARGFTAIGINKSDIIQNSFGYGLFTGGLGFHYGIERLGSTAVPVSTGNTKRQVLLLQDFQTDVLCCTPSYALLIGETVRNMKINPKNLKIRKVVFGAEPSSENMRKQIETLLDCKGYDTYGLSEVCGPGVAYECEEQNGLHISEDYFYPEIINPDTLEVLPDGEYGELVFTCIGKEALPLIRYRTGDIAMLSHSKCSCGRTLVKMSKPKGRNDDMLIIRGVNVFPSQIEYVLSNFGISSNYMIIVDRKNNLDTIQIQVELLPEFINNTTKTEAEIIKEMESALHSILQISAKIILVEQGTLPRFEGKSKKVIDNRVI